MVSVVDARIESEEDNAEQDGEVLLVTIPGNSLAPASGSRVGGGTGVISSPAGDDYIDADQYESESDIESGYVDMGRDRSLVERCQKGDKNAFGILYSHYYRRIYFTCYKVLGNVQDAEDAAQETFARAWRALPSFGGDRRFYPWLSVIASNLCIGNLRKRSRSTAVDEIERLVSVRMQDTNDAVEDSVMSGVERGIATRAFSMLRKRHQRILEMREHLGWSYQQIAEYEGIGIEAVQTLLWRARQALRRQFSELSAPEDQLSEDAIKGSRLKRSGGALGGLFVALGALKRHLAHFSAKMLAYTKSASGVAVIAITSGALAATGIGIGSMLAQPNSARPSVVSGTSRDTNAGKLPVHATKHSSKVPVVTRLSHGAANQLGSSTGKGNGASSSHGTGNGLHLSGLGALPSGGAGGGALNGASSGVNKVVGGVTKPLSGALNTVGGIVNNTASGLGGTLNKLLNGAGSAVSSHSSGGSVSSPSVGSTGSGTTTGGSIGSGSLGTTGSVVQGATSGLSSALDNTLGALGGILEHVGG